MGVQAPAELRALEGWIGPPLDDRAAFFVTARKSGNRLVTGAGNTNTPLGGGGTERDSRWDRRAPGLTVPDAADDLGLDSQPEIIGLCHWKGEEELE
jgi:hypothetical protein